MNRRESVAALFALLAAATYAPTRAQDRGRVATIGVLVVSLRGADYTLAAFREGLRALGYEEGKNLQIELRDAQGDLSRLPALARELVALRPDLIMTANPAGVGAAAVATKTIPIVMGTMSDPVLEGFVASLARPGGNITGVVNQGEDLIPKQFELARELAPRAKRLAYLFNPDPVFVRRNASFQAVAEESARLLGGELVIVGASSAAELERIQAPLRAARAEVLVVALDPVFHAYRKLVVRTAAELRLAAIYPLPAFSEEGGLISYGFNLRDSFRRAAMYADKILKGSKPGELPVERPLKFELIVNLRTAKSLGLRIPDPLLLRADRVIE